METPGKWVRSWVEAQVEAQAKAQRQAQQAQHKAHKPARTRRPFSSSRRRLVPDTFASAVACTAVSFSPIERRRASVRRPRAPHGAHGGRGRVRRRTFKSRARPRRRRGPEPGPHGARLPRRVRRRLRPRALGRGEASDGPRMCLGQPWMGLRWALDGPQMGSRTLKMLLEWSPMGLRTLHWSQIRFRASEGISRSSNCFSQEAAAAVHIVTPKPILSVWNLPFVKLCSIHTFQS